MNIPTISLYFYIAQDVEEHDAAALQLALMGIADAIDWSLGPPQLLASADAEDGPLLGGQLDLYSARPPTILPLEMDRRNLAEVELLIDALRELSQRRGLLLEFELDGEYVGSIEDGELDLSLRAGLLEPWREHLASTGDPQVLGSSADK